MMLFKKKKHDIESDSRAQPCHESPMLQPMPDGSRPLEKPRHMLPAPHHMQPAQPPFRNMKIHVDFDDEDLQILPLVFGSEGDAYAAAEIICSDAPDEMRVQFIQLLPVIKAILSRTDPNVLSMNASGTGDAHFDELRRRLQKGCSRYPSPGLGSGAEELYEKLYGDKAPEYLEALWKAPQEPPIISRMIAFLSDLCQKGA